MHISNLVPTSSTHPPPPQLVNFALTALRRALMHVKSSTWDTTLYLRILGQIDTLLHPVSGDGMDVERKGSGEEAGVPDTDWVEETLENERKEISRLDVELRGYMSNLIKESIRVSIRLPRKPSRSSGGWLMTIAYLSRFCSIGSTLWIIAKRNEELLCRS